MALDDGADDRLNILDWMILSKALLPCLQSRLHANLELTDYPSKHMQLLARTLSAKPALAVHAKHLHLELRHAFASPVITVLEQHNYEGKMAIDSYLYPILRLCRPTRISISPTWTNLAGYMPQLAQALCMSRTMWLEFLGPLKRSRTQDSIACLELLRKAQSSIVTFSIDMHATVISPSEQLGVNIPFCPNLKALHGAARTSSDSKSLTELLFEKHSDRLTELRFGRGTTVKELVAFQTGETRLPLNSLSTLVVGGREVEDGSHITDILGGFRAIRTLELHDLHTLPRHTIDLLARP